MSAKNVGLNNKLLEGQQILYSHLNGCQVQIQVTLKVSAKKKTNVKHGLSSIQGTSVHSERVKTTAGDTAEHA